MPSPSPRRKYSRMLASLGFKRTKDSKRECLVYVKEVNENRIVGVQLWYGGGHRAYHQVGFGTNHTVGTYEGKLWGEDTEPTYFHSITGMLNAIIREATRMDSRRWEHVFARKAYTYG